ncbi:hypothetical protein [Candidatus Solirubrobacter pratensis]|uniref:hypothetical protein n=1 Tax=Candidatus Solirubrobacter pratensis TaxID=1298857 RepID=UPI000412368A|nr:hypothetical protein [Candidatus Solirubrobacter pratensis]
MSDEEDRERVAWAVERAIRREFDLGAPVFDEDWWETALRITDVALEALTLSGTERGLSSG